MLLKPIQKYNGWSYINFFFNFKKFIYVFRIPPLTLTLYYTSVHCINQITWNFIICTPSYDKYIQYNPLYIQLNVNH